MIKFKKEFCNIAVLFICNEKGLRLPKATKKGCVYQKQRKIVAFTRGIRYHI